MRKLFALAAILSAFAFAAPAASAAGSGQFCLKGPGSKMDCNYQTMAACNSAKKGEQACVSNPSATTGAGMSKNDAMKKDNTKK